jgi:ferredoxin
VKVQIDSEKCQGHGRCYDLAPDVFTDDEEGNGQVIGDGLVTSANEESARLAVANCPESAISILEEDGR